jgi:hypothetical protein
MTQRTNFVGRTNEGFTCEHCGAEVLPLLRGGFRNHCPQCLWSKHVDHVPGDRANTCRGLMVPVRVEPDAKREYLVVHRCIRCGQVRRNRAALDDPRQGDSMEAVIAVAEDATERP